MNRPKRPFLLDLAGQLPDLGLGRTVKTKVAGETSDDQDVPSAMGSGEQIPILGSRAVRIRGRVRGRTIITEAKETTDD